MTMWSPSGSPVSWFGLAPARAQCLWVVSAHCSMLEPAVPGDFLLPKRVTLALRAVTLGASLRTAPFMPLTCLKRR